MKINVKQNAPQYKTFLTVKFTYILALQLHVKTLFVFDTYAVIFHKQKEELFLL